MYVYMPVRGRLYGCMYDIVLYLCNTYAGAPRLYGCMYCVVLWLYVLYCIMVVCICVYMPVPGSCYGCMYDIVLYLCNTYAGAPRLYGCMFCIVLWLCVYVCICQCAAVVCIAVYYIYVRVYASAPRVYGCMYYIVICM